MAYYFYLDGVELPIPPASLTLKIKNQNKTITLINEGEVNVLKAPGLTEIKFDMSIPQVRYPFAGYPDGFRSADFYLDKLESLKTGKLPFRFVVSRATPDGSVLFDTDLKVSLEDYQSTEDAKDGFDLKISVNLKQWRDYGTQMVRVSPVASGASGASKAQAVKARPAESAPQVKSYTAVAGDCLWNIAKKLLGDGARYTEIYNLNKDKIKNPNLIYPGQVLMMP